MWRLAIQYSLKCKRTLQIFNNQHPSHPSLIGILYILAGRLKLRPLPAELCNWKKLWTTVLLVLCCNLIWGLTNNNHSLYLLQFLTPDIFVLYFHSLTPRYSWNFVESGIKHHNPVLISTVIWICLLFQKNCFMCIHQEPQDYQKQPL